MAINENFEKGTIIVSNVIPNIMDWFTQLNGFQKFLLIVVVVLVFGVYFAFNQWEKSQNKKNE